MLFRSLETLGDGLAIRGHETQSRATYKTLREIARHGELHEFERLAQLALDGDYISETTPPRTEPLPWRCRPALETIRETILSR